MDSGEVRAFSIYSFLLAIFSVTINQIFQVDAYGNFYLSGYTDEISDIDPRLSMWVVKKCLLNDKYCDLDIAIAVILKYHVSNE